MQGTNLNRQQFIQFQQTQMSPEHVNKEIGLHDLKDLLHILSSIRANTAALPQCNLEGNNILLNTCFTIRVHEKHKATETSVFSVQN